MEGKSNKWVDELNSMLWGIRTSARGPTDETPYALVFGSKAILPAELALPLYRVSAFDEMGNKRQRCLDLDLLEERCVAALLKTEAFKQKTKFLQDKKLVNRPLNVGD